jgi:hypothetical protein
MATYTSTKDGPWNDPATWGGGGYPVAAGDIANIGHTVTYNVVSTVELGQININSAGILTFSTALSTKLTLGQQDIVVNNGGELRVGASGAIISKTYSAELIWNTTADNVKGISLANGGKLTVYGDPDYFGSDCDAVLAVSSGAVPTAGNSITITVTGDFTTKWVAGQELIMHKGGTYASYINDFCRLAITSVAANGSNTDVACTVTERPAALTCAVGADVINVSRNVLIYKLSYNANLGQYNTYRPRIANSNVVGTSNINIHDALFGGWYLPLTGYGVIFDGVIRNSNYGGNTIYFAQINGVIFSSNYGSTATFCTVNAAMFGIGGYAVVGGWGSLFTGNVFGNNNASATGGYFHTYAGNYYANGSGTSLGNSSVLTGKVGFNSADITIANGVDFAFNAGGNVAGLKGYTKVLNAKIPSSPIFQNRNLLHIQGRFQFEHYQQIANAHYICDAYGDITKTAADGTGDNPTQRSGGSADVIEAVPQSNCAAVSYLELLHIRLWAEAGVNKTYRFYLQTDYAALAKNVLVLYGQYLDQGSGGHLGSANSSTSGNFTTRSNQSDWSQYVEVTINPAQNGYINLYLWLMGYESSKKIWIDPKVAITGGDAVTVTPRWSYGEVQLDIDPVATGGGGSSPPVNSGLLPLGVMEVVV